MSNRRLLPRRRRGEAGADRGEAGPDRGEAGPDRRFRCRTLRRAGNTARGHLQACCASAGIGTAWAAAGRTLLGSFHGAPGSGGLGWDPELLLVREPHWESPFGDRSY